MRRSVTINGCVAGGVALVWMALTVHSPVSAGTKATFSRAKGIASSGSASRLVSHRRIYGSHERLGHRSSHYDHGSRYYSYRPSYYYGYRPSFYGSSYGYGYRPMFGYYYYSYRPRYYGYGYARPYYFSYSYPRSVYGVYPPVYSPYRSYTGYRLGQYDYGGYRCPPAVCCPPCEPAPTETRKPSGIPEAPQPQPQPQPEPERELPPTPPSASGPAI